MQLRKSHLVSDQYLTEMKSYIAIQLQLKECAAISNHDHDKSINSGFSSLHRMSTAFCLSNNLKVVIIIEP